MAAEDDDHLAYGGDETREKIGPQPPKSPRPETADTDGNIQPEERQAREIIDACLRQKRKAEAIIDACRRRDFEDLQALAEAPGGFLRNEWRQVAWPILLGIPVGFRDDGDTPFHVQHEPVRLITSEPVGDSWRRLRPHREEDQVKLDVNRAFVYYPHYESDQELARQKQELSDLILSVLRRYPYLCYFQGYHDICQVFLLVLPPSLRGPAVARLSALRIRDFMLPNLSAALAQLRLIPDIIRAADPALAAHLPLSNGSEPFFALSGTITMYAHDVQSLAEITRLFDVLLAAEPVFSVYLFAQIVIGRRDELFAWDADEPEILHSVLSRLPQPLGADALVASARRLLADHPPESLPSWRRGISQHSVLKTARSARDCAGQNPAVGEYYFGQQLMELRRAERRDRLLRALWRHRGTARAVGFAVAFGVLAYWMRRSALSGGAAAGPVGYITGLAAAWWRKL